MRDNGEDGIQTLDSENQLTRPDDQVTSENLPKNVSMRLYELMKKVVEKDVTPATVNAACNCAAEIQKMLKLNLEIRRSFTK